jgi:hypothetical protein
MRSLHGGNCVRPVFRGRSCPACLHQEGPKIGFITSKDMWQRTPSH